MTVAIDEFVINELNAMRERKGLPHVTEEQLRESAAGKPKIQFSAENRTHEFKKVGMGETGATAIIPADFRLIGFFDNCAIFTRTGLTENEEESQRLQAALDEFLNEQPAEVDDSAPIDFLARLAQAQQQDNDE